MSNAITGTMNRQLMSPGAAMCREIMLKRLKRQEKMAKLRAEAHEILMGKRAAGDDCSFLEAVSLRKVCWEIQRVLRGRMNGRTTLREAARIHAQVEKIRSQMSKFSTYAAAVREYLRRNGEIAREA